MSWIEFNNINSDEIFGDKLVITYNGRTEEFEAGEPYPYKSHIETPVTKKVRV